jgi:hypothetical protein
MYIFAQTFPVCTHIRRSLSGCLLVGFAVLLGGCTSGSKNNVTPPPQVTAPSGLTYSQNSIDAMVGTAITTDTPTVTGEVSAYSVAPALPTGLSLDKSKGTVSGTPTVAAAQTTYTVTASNAGGSTTAQIKLTVDALPAPSGLAYPKAAIHATVGTAIAGDTPTVTGTVTAYSIEPTLPAGLSLDAITGTISGTPTAVAPQASYTVTASNAGGSTTAQIQISVAAAPVVLMDLGHTSGILAIRADADRVLSEDDSGHWNLWDYATGQSVANGDGGVTTNASQIALNTSLAAVNTSSGVVVIDSSDGHPVFTAPKASWWAMAPDGSYICTGSATALTVYSPDRVHGADQVG